MDILYLRAVWKRKDGNSLKHSFQPGHKNERKTLVRMDASFLKRCPSKKENLLILYHSNKISHDLEKD